MRHLLRLASLLFFSVFFFTLATTTEKLNPALNARQEEARSADESDSRFVLINFFLLASPKQNRLARI
jgi:hypothetical protein